MSVTITSGANTIELPTIADLSTNKGASDGTTLRVAIANNSDGLISTGTAGSPASQVLTVQGIANGTPAPVQAALETSNISNAGAALTPHFATIVANTSGATTIVANTAGKQIRVLALKVTASNTVNAKWQSHVTPTDLTGLSYFGAAGDGEVLPFNPVGWFQTVSGEALDINLSAAVAVGGHLTYILV